MYDYLDAMYGDGVIYQEVIVWYHQISYSIASRKFWICDTSKLHA